MKALIRSRTSVSVRALSERFEGFGERRSRRGAEERYAPASRFVSLEEGLERSRESSGEAKSE